MVCPTTPETGPESLSAPFQITICRARKSQGNAIDAQVLAVVFDQVGWSNVMVVDNQESAT